MDEKLLVLLTSITLLTGFSVAQPGDVESRPGFIKPGTAIYGLDVAFDDAAVNLGLRDRGDVAYERASELGYAYENNLSEQQRERVQNQLKKVAQVASSNETTGLEKAEAVLGQIRTRLQEKGLDTTGVDTTAMGE